MAAARKYCVPQRHAEYTPIEHETWRRLLARAEALVTEYEGKLHGAYVEGFRRLVLPWTAIPRLEDVSAALAPFGWQTLCVNGYIPPEVYSGLLASGVFPISRDIRPMQHLEYSPTPDLAHDMLGHIPMLISAEHCQFLRRISRSTASQSPNPLDHELYLAHRALGALRNASSRKRRALSAAEDRVASAQRALGTQPSPLTELDRLYLWSIEFGLMGNPTDFRLYGAGLLSSAGEVEGLCAGRAPVLDFSAAVLRKDINFSEYQSVYYAARDYAQLNDVLTELEASWDVASGRVLRTPERPEM